MVFLFRRDISCPLSATVAKTSAGAIEYVPVARISNVAQTIKDLKNKECGLWALIWMVKNIIIMLI